MNKVLVLGASAKPIRFSYKTVKSLLRRNYPVVAVGRKPGKIDNVDILVGKPKLDDIHTVMLYMNPDNQRDYYDYILNMAPRRIIFNPGTENPELMEMAENENIKVVIDCGLVMLNSHTF